MVVADAGHVQQACLDEEALARLAALGAAYEDLFGHAQNIEWAKVSTRLSLLQCSPVMSGGKP
jgi:phosphoenolpyruvate synthase/pyruvate phosphate dikinase